MRARLDNILAEGLWKHGWERTCFKLACSPKEEVFAPEMIIKGRVLLHEWLSSQQDGYAEIREKEPEVEPGQPFLLNLLRGILRQANDADAEFMSELKMGVTAGILHPMPRQPLVYEEQH